MELQVIEKVSKELIALGLQPHHLGFYYLRDMVLRYKMRPYAELDEVYFETAVRYKTTAQRVDATIRKIKSLLGIKGSVLKLIVCMARKC